MAVGKSQYSRRIISHGVYLYIFCEFKHSFILASLLHNDFSLHFRNLLVPLFPRPVSARCQGADFQRQRGSPEMDFQQVPKQEDLYDLCIMQV